MKAINENIFIETCYILNEKIEIVINFPSTWSVLLYVAALLVSVSLSLTALFLNGVTVVTIWNSRTLKERVSNFLILIQSTIDLANGVILIPLSAMLLASDLVGSPSCILVYTVRKIGHLLYFYSMTTMFVMSVERYLGVLHPFVHRVKVTKTRLLKGIISVCIFQTILHSFSVTHGLLVTRPFFVTNMFLFLAFTVFAYARMFWFSTKKNRFLTGQQVVNVTKGINIGTKGRLIKEYKTAKSCFLVVITSLVCSLPVIMLVAVLDLETSFLVVTVRKWSYILNMFNSTANSLIYFWLNKALRNEGIIRMKNFLNKTSTIRPDNS